MVQFNLLPDVKLEYIKAVKRRRLITIGSVLATSVSLFVFVLIFIFVKFNQPRHMDHLDADIQGGISQLRSVEDLDKILTIQNQLGSITQLHEEKMMASRVFEYMSTTVPKDVSITGIEITKEESKLVFKGRSKDLATLNKFVDTLKFAQYSKKSEPEAGKLNAFSGVVLSSYSIDSSGEGNSSPNTINFEVSMVYDPIIFHNTATAGNPLANDIKLSVPNIVSGQLDSERQTQTENQAEGQ